MIHVPSSPANTCFMDRCRIAELDEIQNGKRVYWNRPFSSPRTNCWYALRRSTIVNFVQEDTRSRISSNVRIGNCSVWIIGLIVPLKSPKMRTDSSVLGTQTIGVAQSLTSSGLKTPSISNRLSSSSQCNTPTASDPLDGCQNTQNPCICISLGCGWLTHIEISVSFGAPFANLLFMSAVYNRGNLIYARLSTFTVRISSKVLNILLGFFWGDCSVYYLLKSEDGR